MDFGFSNGKVRGQKRDTSRPCQSSTADRPVPGEHQPPDMFGACQNKAMTTDVDSLMHIKNMHRQVCTVVRHGNNKTHAHSSAQTNMHTHLALPTVKILNANACSSTYHTADKHTVNTHPDSFLCICSHVYFLYFLLPPARKGCESDSK